MSSIPPSPKRRPQVGDLMEVIDPSVEIDSFLTEVSRVRGQYVFIRSDLGSFHVKDDLIASSKGDTWRLTGGGVVRFATTSARTLDPGTPLS